MRRAKKQICSWGDSSTHLRSGRKIESTAVVRKRKRSIVHGSEASCHAKKLLHFEDENSDNENGGVEETKV
jgi:hypothetical protein